MTAYQNPLPCGIMFHHFHDRRHHPGQGSLSQEQFARVLEFLGPKRILSPREWMTRALAGRLEAQDLCLTFDDGLLCQYDIAVPVLKSMGLEAFFFVYTSVLEGHAEKLEIYRHFRSTQFASVEEFYQRFFVRFAGSSWAADPSLQSFDPKTYLSEFAFYSDDDRRFRFLRDRVLGPMAYTQLMDAMIAESGYDTGSAAKTLWMGAAELTELARAGHLIGLHSHTHPTLISALSSTEQEREYHANTRALENILGVAPETMSHPCNSYSPETLEILRKMGVKLGFRSNLAPVANRSALEFPRADHTDILKQASA